MDETWDRIQPAYIKAGVEVLGYSNIKRETWMSLEILQAIEKRQLLKLKLINAPTDSTLQEEYSKLRSLIKKLARRD